MAELSYPLIIYGLWCKMLLVCLLLLLNRVVVNSKSMFALASELEGFGDDSDEEEVDERPSIFVAGNSDGGGGAGAEVPLGSKGGRRGYDANGGRTIPDRSAQPNLNGNLRSEPESQWDEDEFVGIPTEARAPEQVKSKSQKARADPNLRRPLPPSKPLGPLDFVIEAVSLLFLVAYGVNYYLGKKKNESVALAWARQFAAAEGSVLERNFSLLGVGDGINSPLLLKEGQNAFKFYASGRRYCEGMMITLDMKNRHDLISLLCNFVVQKRDSMTAEVYMNEESMDPFVLSVVKRKISKSFQRENFDLKSYGSVLDFSNKRNWPSDELSVISDSREAANDILSGAVIDQVFGEKKFEKQLNNMFVSLHFTDQNQNGKHKKTLRFNFNLPDARNISDLSRLMALIPYFIDTVGKFKLSSSARAKADVLRVKQREEEMKEKESMRLEMVQKRRDEKRKAEEIRRAELEARLTPEALARKLEKERQKAIKQSLPKVKISKVH